MASFRNISVALAGGLFCCLGATCFGPEPSPEPIVPDDGQYVSQDGSIQFTVFTDNGTKRVLFRGQFVDVVDGICYVQKGDIRGTNCPTDGFTFSAQFSDTRTAQGTFTPLQDCGYAAPPTDWTAALVEPPPNCVNPCADALNSSIQQASTSPNQIIQAETGTGDGQIFARSAALNQTDVLLLQGQGRVYSFALTKAAKCTFEMSFSDDGPGTTDQITLTVEGQSRTLSLSNTRPTVCPPGSGWNMFCVAGPTTDPVLLAAGQHQITVTLSQADAFGAEMDALLIFAGPAVIDVTSVEALRTAIAQAPPGTTIRVAAGTYVVDRSIEIARNDITMQGEGDATLFVLAQGVRDPVFIIGEPTPFAPTITHRGVVLRSMWIRGSRFANPQPGDELSATLGRSYLRNNCLTIRQASDCTVENVKLETAASGGVILEQTCRNITLRNLECFGNTFDGIAWDGDIQNSRIENCTLRNNSGAGLSFDVGPANNLVTGCLIQANVKVGLFLRHSDTNTFDNCTISGNGEDAVFLADNDLTGVGATNNVFANNQYRNNTRHGIWQAGAHSTGNQIQGGTICGNGGTPVEESFPATAPLITTGVTTAATCP